jgi:hypothetical protein
MTLTAYRLENKVGHRSGIVGKQVEGIAVGTPPFEWVCVLGQKEQTGQSVDVGTKLLRTA